MTSSIECKNFLRSLQLLNLLIKIGVQNLILCPGSRSAPLSIAAGELNKLGLINTFNSIDDVIIYINALGFFLITELNQTCLQLKKKEIQ